MSYKTLLYAFLVVSHVACAQIKLDIDMTMKEQDGNRHITQEIVLDNNGHVLLDCEDLIITMHVHELESEEGVYIRTDIAKKSEVNKGEFVAQPVIVAQWDKQATITLGTRTNDNESSFKILVKASRV